MLKITGLKKNYKTFEVLRGLDMNLEKGDVYGFLGKNGCGKTTTMNIICNIVAKDEGKIEFDGGGKPKIGYLTESPALYGFMDGYEYLRYIANCAGYDGDVEKRVAEVLEITGMSQGALRRIKGYSRGMNQRLGIAAAIFDKPELLILDEPTSALDPEGRVDVMDIIGNLKQTGVTIILCTHIIADVERVANKIGIMKDGLMATEGSIEQVMSRHRSADTRVTVRFNEPPGEALAAMRMLPSVSFSDYHEPSGTVTLGAADSAVAATLYHELIALLAQKQIRVSELYCQKTTLEDVYFAVTGLKGASAGVGGTR